MDTKPVPAWDNRSIRKVTSDAKGANIASLVEDTIKTQVKGVYIGVPVNGHVSVFYVPQIDKKYFRDTDMRNSFVVETMIRTQDGYHHIGNF
jgi:hypothetical protein